MIPTDFRTPANAALSRGQIALRLLTPTAIAKSPVSTPQQAGQSDAISKPVLSPAAWNAIFDVAAPADAVNPVSALPEAVSALGADGWKPHDFGALSVARMSDEDFKKTVVESMLPSYANDASFSRALDNGTLKIERAENTQLMGTFKFYNLDLYRNGQYVGVMGASSGKLNDAFLDGLSAKGMRFGYGVINDQMFLMTWPAETPAAQGG